MTGALETAAMHAQTSPPAAAPLARVEMTDELARKYLVRVMAHAKRLARRLPAHVSLNDLVSAGLLGVVEGFLRFDPARLESLDAYLDHRIRGAMMDELRRVDPLTRVQRGFARELGRASRDLSAQRGAATEEALAGALDLDVGELRRRVAQLATATSLHATADEDGTDRVADQGPAPDESAAASEARSLLAHATAALPPREREVLRLYYEESRTLREIGTAMSVSESRVSQLHSQAIRRLRALLVD